MGREDKSVAKKLLIITSNLTKGAACFELVPDRRFALMKTSRHSHWWEIYNLRVGRRLSAFKTMETHFGYIDTYALPAALALDALRLSYCIYKDEGIGGSVIRTGGSIAGAWVGGYFCAQVGYKAGQSFGALLSPTQEGMFAVIFGYVGGLVGAQYGEKLFRYLLLQND